MRPDEELTSTEDIRHRLLLYVNHYGGEMQAAGEAYASDRNIGAAKACANADVLHAKIESLLGRLKAI